MAGRFVLESNEGRFVLEEEEAAPTAAYRNPNSLTRETAETQVRGAPTQTRAPRPSRGNIAQQISRAVTGEGQRQRGVGEIAYQSVPEERDQKFEGTALGPVGDFAAGVANALPRGVRNFVGAQGRANNIGVGFFLNPNEQARAQIIKRQVPTAEFRRDEYGNLQVRYRPTTPWAYINRPGLSTEDVQTFGNEAGKYIAASRIPGLRATRAEGLIAGTTRAAVTGGVTSAVGQGLSTRSGAEEVNLGDVAVNAAGAGAGNVIGAGVVGVAKTAPALVRTAAREIGDRLPGGPARVAARATAQSAAQTMAENVARQHAEQMVRANAAQLNLVGDGLEAAVKEAQDNAVAAVQSQWSPGRATELDKLAKSFGLRLARAQTTGDTEGMRFMYEAAGGLHGPAAQRASTAFLEAQNRALPEAIRSIAGDLGVTSPQAAVNTVRTGLERAASASREAENAAWKEFDAAVPNIRTHDVTPSGKPGAAKFVRDRLQGILVQDKKMIRPEAGDPMMLPEFEATYPRVARVMSLANRMATGTKAEMPMRDVDRVIQLKRFIDAQWDGAEPAEQRVLTMMGREVRDWLKETGGGYVATAEAGGGRAARNLNARGATVTGNALQKALGLSAEHARTFRENPIIADMLDARLRQTDEEVARRLFGGGQGGINVSGDGVKALAAIKQALGPSSPGWEAIRQGALQRLSRGLDDAIPTNQTPAILTTFKRIEEAFRANREAMEVLFSPQELARLRQAQRVVAAMSPTPRNPANPSGSGITTGRALQNALKVITDMLRQVPGANIVAGGAADVSAAARVSNQMAGAPSQASSEISDALRELWFGKPTRLSGVTAATANDMLNNPSDEE